MGNALASSPKAFLGLITPARDRSRFHPPRDRGSVGGFSNTNAGPEVTDRASPKRLQPLFMPPEALLAASAFSRNECADEAKSKTACGDDTNRLIKPACVQISTFLHARRQLNGQLQGKLLSAYKISQAFPGAPYIALCVCDRSRRPATWSSGRFTQIMHLPNGTILWCGKGRTLKQDGEVAQGRKTACSKQST